MKKFIHLGIVASFAFCSCAKEDNGVLPVPTNEISLNCKYIEFDVQNIYCKKIKSSSGRDPFNKQYSYKDSSYLNLSDLTGVYLMPDLTKKTDLAIEYHYSNNNRNGGTSNWCRVKLSADKTMIDTLYYGASHSKYEGSPGSHSSEDNSFEIKIYKIKPTSITDSVITFNLVQNSIIQGLDKFNLNISSGFSNMQASNSSQEITTGCNSASDSTKFIVRLRYK